MTPYFLVAALLGGFSLLENGARNRWQLFGLASAGILALFAGLRFETGYDWAPYESYFFYAPPFGDHMVRASYRAIEEVTGLKFEPGFDLLCRALKSVGLSYQYLFIFVSIVNMAVLYLVAREFTGRISLVLVWYFGVAFMSGQMAEVRQSFSVSFILIAILARERRRVILSVALCMAAISFHVFSIFFVPLVYYRGKPPKFWLVIALTCLGIGFAFAGINIIPALVNIITSVVGGATADKLGFYGRIGGSPISLATSGLIVWHIGVLYLLMRRYPGTGIGPPLGGNLAKDATPPNRLGGVAIYATIMSLMAHSLLAPISIFWVRIMLLTLPLQTAEVIRLYEPWIRPYFHKLAVCGGALVLSCVSLLYFLSNPQSASFVPYQSTISVALTGDRGNGRQRFEAHVRESEQALHDAMQQ